MPDLREVELRIAVAEGVLSRSEADVLGEEARRAQQSPLALLVARGRITDESYQSFFAAALNDPAWRAAGHDASASTYTMEAVPAAVAEPPFPVAVWDRYVNVRFLGQGGMGKVFLAVDTGLRREVAIKFVRGDDAEHVRRLIGEARTQARVSHERVCRVYEVGEVDGKVYIAMQYIHGKPLGQLIGELTLEQKVMLVRGAADGIAEAHSKGIIHRDIKPSNIMVERTDDGDIRPYVMDFGLARSAQEAGTTMTGAVLGTPRYMAPEQAQGETAKLDRRADIYSLGATLYHLVTGAPPVRGETAAEVIAHLISEEPIPPRGHDANIPVDLEAIVLKCLEKERTQRYDSARALVDDLDRFLRGEPVHARPANTWYRLAKLVARHRRLITVATVLLVALAVAIGWAIKTSGDAGERERLAREFTERVERIESTALASALSPRHDVRGDRKAIRDQMTALDDDIRRAGVVAAGPGHYALGRGYLALGDDERARVQLEAGWDEGFREPRAAYALALAIGHLYQQALLAAERIDDKDQREAKKRDIEKQYRDPAIRLLVQSKAAGAPSPEYVAALVAFYDGKLDDALKHLDAMGGGPPWFHEARKLRGDILFARALGFRNDNQPDRARADLAAGREAYAAAAEIGRSVAAVYTSLADLEYAAVAMEIYGNGDVMPPIRRALVAAEHALEVAPDDCDGFMLRAKLRRSQVDHQTNQGVRVDDLLASALGDAQRAVALAPGRSSARLELARVHLQWGNYLYARREDPSERLAAAVAIATQIPVAERDTGCYLVLGTAYSVWADYQDGTGGDGEDKRRLAIEAQTQAIQYGEAHHARTALIGPWLNLGVDSLRRGARPRASDPDGDLRRAIQAFEKVKSLDAKQRGAYFYEGQAYEALAERSRNSGRDPEGELQQAQAAYRGGLQINARDSLFENGIGIVFQALAKAAWDRGGDPGPALVEARTAFQHAIDAAPESGFGYGNVGEVIAQRAWFQRARGEDPAASVADAMTVLNQAIARIPNQTIFWADLGMAHATGAAYDLEHGRDPQPNLTRASSALHTALAKNARDVQSLLYLAEVRGLEARLQARRGQGKAGDFAEAAEAFQRAIDLAPDNLDYRLVFGHFCREWAGFLRDHAADPDPAIRRGLAAADQALSRRASWPDALVLRASLTLAQARAAADPAPRRRDAERARKDFTAALDGNPALAKVWAGQAAEARQLASP